MSELTEALWAVLSERGCEANALTYAQAAELMRALQREKVSGLSVITDAAAHRAAPNNTTQQQQRPRNSNTAGRQVKTKR
jgi:hypothetical protein